MHKKHAVNIFLTSRFQLKGEFTNYINFDVLCPLPTVHIKDVDRFFGS